MPNEIQLIGLTPNTHSADREHGGSQLVRRGAAAKEYEAFCHNEAPDIQSCASSCFRPLSALELKHTEGLITRAFAGDSSVFVRAAAEVEEAGGVDAACPFTFWLNKIASQAATQVNPSG
jgi:hypothetical protein